LPTDRLLLDTHVLVWTLEDDARLGTTARSEIVRARDADILYVSITSLWELGCLAAKGKIRVPDLRAWWLEAVRRLRATELPIGRSVILEFFQLEGMHNDPGDRFLVATALREKITLVTADEKILAWCSSHCVEGTALDARR